MWLLSAQYKIDYKLACSRFGKQSELTENSLNQANMTKGRNPINFPQGTLLDLFTCSKTTLSPGVLADVFRFIIFPVYLFHLWNGVIAEPPSIDQK
jgi:hypothetical protein